MIQLSKKNKMNKDRISMRIEDFFKLHKEVAVAFSGGVDSAVLLLLSKKYADRVEAYYVKSAFQPEFEYNDALIIAKMLDIKLNVISVDVLSDDTVVKNPADRCYYCKKRVFAAIIASAAEDGFNTVLDGTNFSDDIDDRPGFRALSESGVLSPLRLCGYAKKDIRKIARENGLPVSDKPSYACLATRIPTNTVITKELLEKTEKAENILFDLGFKNFRVRNLGSSAKLELGREDFNLIFEKRDLTVKMLSEFYENIYLDLKERADE